jgi:hypothetical protein
MGERYMRHTLTKLGIVAGLVGATVLTAVGPTVAKSVRTEGAVEHIPYNYTCKPSWFHPGYYCYQADPYDVSGYDAYGSYYACPAAVWNGRQWVRREVC